MHRGKSRFVGRFVAACQQLLALSVVFAVLAPVTSVVSLEVVSRAEPNAGAPAMRSATTDASAVEGEAVEAEVSEVSLVEPGTAAADSVLSEPQPVDGYGAVGVTWSPRDELDDGEITLQARTQTEGSWSQWTEIVYDAEHGPDPDSAEGRSTRPGTDVLLVGDVDQVQVKVSMPGTEESVPADLKLAVITPGESEDLVEEAPSIDTANLGAAGVGDLSVTDEAGASDLLALTAGGATPKPQIYSRSQWGADESQREASSLNYGEVHAGFVHHTVNANDYTRAEVPGMIRSIYAYHTRTRGWSDIGYNFLIDRFGRIWEGRYGGVDRPVVGAHTLNYNDYAFAAAAIGNFETAAPSSALLSAYGTLFAWKLSLHGVDPASTSQRVGKRDFPAVNGHRDAAATACPGKNLYAKLASIRTLAAGAQASWGGRQLDGDLVKSEHPDLVVRRASDKMAYVVATGGLTRFRAPVTSSTGWGSMTAVVASPDLTGDGRADLVARSASGVTRVYPGNGAGRFGSGIRPTTKFKRVTLITAAGDLNRDRRNDLVALRRSDDRLVVYLGRGKGRFAKRVLPQVFAGYDLLTGAGDVTGDGRPDLVGRDADGRLYIHRGGKLSQRTAIRGTYTSIDSIAGFGDHTRDGRADLVVRTAKKGKAYVLPSRGNGTFGHLLGPLKSLRGLQDITSGGQMIGFRTPDLVARSGDRLVVVASRGTYHTSGPIPTGTSLASSDLLLNVGDWDGDGNGDIVTRATSTGTLELRRGNGRGQFVPPATLGTGFGTVSHLAAVGDMTGDGYPDLMGQPAGQGMRIYPGRGRSGLGVSYGAAGIISADRYFGVGRWDTDGAPDALARKADILTMYVGNGPGGFTGSRTLSLDVSGYDWVGGIGNLRGKSHPALIVRNAKTGDLWTIGATASGFAKPRFLAESFSGYDLIG